MKIPLMHPSKGCLHVCYTLLCTLFTSFSLFSQVVQTPIPSVVGGLYGAPFSVSLSSSTAGAVVRYTLDGSVPDSLASLAYTTPLLINKMTTLRAKAFGIGVPSSAVATHTYLYNVSHTVPIVALSFNDKNFFDDSIGIYKNYLNKALQAETHVEFFEKGAKTADFSQLTTVEIQGQATTALPQKSLEIKANAALGAATIPYRLFPDLPYTTYTRLVLRNGGQDWGVTMFRDEMASNLINTGDLNGIIKTPDLNVSATRPSVVYLNGTYWGIHNMHERMKTTFVEQHFGLTKPQYDMLENENEVLNGDITQWQLLINDISTQNFSNNANFETLKQRIDMSNWIDYNVFNVYIDNEDWPANNVRRFRPRTPTGKWRWVCWDFDFSFGLFQVTGGFNTGDPTPNSLQRLLDLSLQYSNNFPWSTLLFRKCMENASFRRDFINRTADMMNTVFKPNRISNKIDSFRTLYEPEMARHVAKWGSPFGAIWGQNIEKMRFFATNRPQNVLSHFQNQLSDITGNANVTLNASPAVGGSIRFSTVRLTTANYPWVGTYFKGVPIPVKAIAAPGY